MTYQRQDRHLATREIELAVHLLRVGGGRMPVLLLSTAKPVATQLWRIGLVNIWHRQSVSLGRPEGPFYSLTHEGVYRAESLHVSRQRLAEREARHSELYFDESTPPPAR